ncbi:hypothetical protein A2960_03440 [Candidatus Gottesmanbacteria bacterium RIFCSPLOWO2_01_FULL_39_12b]|uniref:HypC/HybG/HupF family hydrogenase formation chaperone n=1 Tax=Candidatus Gottesmanbacteria bacterium RIFCSPLOWO2_01_FULL_39_12b TaxID=1798388 RepID=A0A1F6ANU5_9BACT|nr:MAG: hypothetical protein A2960_03440 [Candidatus Gottesmanbacteria bacterium RIFCSPLOWO2_01_FULL_39_12b]
MCFSIPLKVLKAVNNYVLIEGGQTVRLGNEIKVKKGDFLQVAGNMAVGKLSKSQGLKIRKLIKKLNN